MTYIRFRPAIEQVVKFKVGADTVLAITLLQTLHEVVFLGYSKPFPDTIRLPDNMYDRMANGVLSQEHLAVRLNTSNSANNNSILFIFRQDRFHYLPLLLPVFLCIVPCVLQKLCTGKPGHRFKFIIGLHEAPPEDPRSYVSQRCFATPSDSNEDD